MTRPTPGTLRERFDALWVPEPNTGCWLWFGRRPYGRYGYFHVRPGEHPGISVPRYKDWLAHRVAWELRHGPIPDGMYVCHRCDVPECVNPDHMFLGTQFDNMRDCARKGRAAGNRVTHCPRGHEYTPENTDVGTRNGGRQRRCKECRRRKNREAYRSRANKKSLVVARVDGDPQ